MRWPLPVNASSFSSSTRDAEVEQLHLPIRSHHDIARLEIPMNDQIRVRILNRRAHVLEQVQTRFDRQTFVVAVARDGPAVDELHREERQPVVGDTAVEQSRDVGMLQARQDAALGAETRQNGIRVHSMLDDFEGDALLELPIGTLGQIHHTHAAASHRPNQSV